jgi:hypothetical protein
LGDGIVSFRRNNAKLDPTSSSHARELLDEIAQSGQGSRGDRVPHGRRRHDALILIFLFLLLRFSKRPVAILAIICALSYGSCVIITPLSHIYAFYLLPTRAWELLVGSSLVCWASLLYAICPRFGPEPCGEIAMCPRVGRTSARESPRTNGRLYRQCRLAGFIACRGLQMRYVPARVGET